MQDKIYLNMCSKLEEGKTREKVSLSFLYPYISTHVEDHIDLGLLKTKFLY